MTVTIAIVNRKGGVGKTTTALSIGGAYAAAGRRTLIVDLDAQMSLTSCLLGAGYARHPDGTAAGIFEDCGGTTLLSAIVPTPVPHLSMVPGSERMDALNCLRPATWGVTPFALRDFLAEDCAGYDRVVIDCPPNLQFCSWAAMTAADHVVTPLEADGYGARSVAHVLRAVDQVRRSTNPRCQILGLVLTKFQARHAVQAGFAAELRRTWADLVLRAAVPLTAQFREADLAGKPVSVFRPRGAAAKAVAAVVEELEARMCATGRAAA